MVVLRHRARTHPWSQVPTRVWRLGSRLSARTREHNNMTVPFSCCNQKGRVVYTVIVPPVVDIHNYGCACHMALPLYKCNVRDSAKSPIGSIGRRDTMTN